jgi:hypothetical protein
MTPPSMPRAPSYSPPGQQAFMPPPMTGNLMPAPVMPSALDYVRPLPQVVPFPLPEPGDEWDFRGTGST